MLARKLFNSTRERLNDSIIDDIVPFKADGKPKSTLSLRAQTAKMTSTHQRRITLPSAVTPKKMSMRRPSFGTSRESQPSTSAVAKSVPCKSQGSQDITPPNQWIPRPGGAPLQAGGIKGPKRKSIRFQDPIEGLIIAYWYIFSYSRTVSFVQSTSTHATRLIPSDLEKLEWPSGRFLNRTCQLFSRRWLAWQLQKLRLIRLSISSSLQIFNWRIQSRKLPHQL